MFIRRKLFFPGETEPADVTDHLEPGIDDLAAKCLRRRATSEMGARKLTVEYSDGTYHVYEVVR